MTFVKNSEKRSGNKNFTISSNSTAQLIIKKSFSFINGLASLSQNAIKTQVLKTKVLRKELNNLYYKQMHLTMC